MICPNCSKEIDVASTSCPYCQKSTTQQVIENWKSSIDQVVMGYDEHRGLVHGLQKDAIQNGWGHRFHKSGKNWKFVFELLRCAKNNYLFTMTDVGGYGLTGKNMVTEEIPDALPEDERLARFEHMFFSGGATQGAGLFGRGKLIFTAASKVYYIIYDSLTHDGIYRLNRRRLEGRKLENYAKAYEGGDAKKMLGELTVGCLKPLKENGTRIIIVNPMDELVEAIDSGKFIQYIEETWWQVLRKEGVQICVKTDKGTQNAKVPSEFRNLPEDIKGKWKGKLIQPLKFDYEGLSLRIKKAHFVVSPEPISPEHKGVYLYRREMKVADIELKDVPPEIEDKFYGYLELETGSELETLFLEKRIEGPEHYSLNKNQGLCRKIKKAVQLEFEKFRNELGYGVNATKVEREKTERILKESLEELHKRMGNLGISIGKITQTKDIKIHIESLVLPSEGNLVQVGDEIKNIKYKIENTSNSEFKLRFVVSTKIEGVGEVEKLFDKTLTLLKNEHQFLGPFSFLVTQTKYPAKGKILLCCRAVDEVKDKVLAFKNVAFYVGQEPEKIEELVKIDIDKIVFPRGPGNRRVNYDEEVKGIVHSITNNVNDHINAKLKLKVMDSKTKAVIDDLCEKDIHLDPFQNISLGCPALKVSREKYSVLDRERGPVFLRASIVALEDSSAGLFAKADRLARSDLRFWVNMDSGKGIFEDTYTWPGGPEEPRSKVQLEGQGFVFYLNDAHPAYEIVKVNDKDESAERRFTYEQMLRQTLKLLFLTDKVEFWPADKYKDNIISDGSEKQDIIESYASTLDLLYGEFLK